MQELVVDIDRRLKFSDEIEISLEEIPPGVICPPVRSESKQVKLMLTAGPTPFQGVLTIKGRSTAEPSLERIATVKPSPDKPFSGKTWLTVTAPAPELALGYSCEAVVLGTTSVSSVDGGAGFNALDRLTADSDGSRSRMVKTFIRTTQRP